MAKTLKAPNAAAGRQIAAAMIEHDMSAKDISNNQNVSVDHIEKCLQAADYELCEQCDRWFPRWELSERNEPFCIGKFCPECLNEIEGEEE